MGPRRDLPSEKSFDGVFKSLAERRRDLQKYTYLLDVLRQTDTSTDIGFQSVFESFYVVRARNGEWLDACFTILEREKNNTAVCFESVLKELLCKTGRMEASFSSKIIATINPRLPVWDRWVLHNLNLKKVYGNSKDPRYLARCVDRYGQIHRTVTTIVKEGPNFHKWVSRLDEAYPAFAHFTEVKKLDLFLWLYRE